VGAKRLDEGPIGLAFAVDFAGVLADEHGRMLPAWTPLNRATFSTTSDFGGFWHQPDNAAVHKPREMRESALRKIFQLADFVVQLGKLG
jgi:hypothetical protein